MERLQCPSEVEPIHHRHVDVGHDYGNSRGEAAHDHQRLLTIARLKHSEPGVIQGSSESPAKHLVIIN